MKKVLSFIPVLLSVLLPTFLMGQTYITYKPLYSYTDEMEPIKELLEEFRADYSYDNPVTTIYDTMLYNVYDYNPNEVPVFSSDVISTRLRSTASVIPLDYNSYVQRYIDLYTLQRRDLVARMLGLSKVYFPLFEAELDKEKMPIELKYLTIVESALNPHARSRVGATGLWQFMPATGLEYGLKIDSYVDERKDPYKSTTAAIQYLKRSYAQFGDWLLAIASYNCGPNNVKKAINRSGGQYNFWAIREYLPAETRGYVPAFIAAMYTFQHASEHNFIPVPVDFSLYQDTLHIKGLDMSLNDIAQLTNVDVDMLRNLNPELKMDIIPYSLYEPYILRVPFKVSEYFSTYPSYVAEKFSRKYYSSSYYVNADGTITYVSSSPSTTVTTYDENGNPSGSYNTDASTPSYSSNSESTVSRGVAPKAASVKPAAKTEAKHEDKHGKTQYYKVKHGDTLWEIAKKYDVTVDSLRKLNGSKAAKLTVGESLRVK